MAEWLTERLLQLRFCHIIVDNKFTSEMSGNEFEESVISAADYILALDPIDVDDQSDPYCVLYRFPASVRPAPPNYPVGPPPVPPPRPRSPIPFGLPSVPPVLPTPQTDWMDSYSADSESESECEYDFESESESEWSLRSDLSDLPNRI